MEVVVAGCLPYWLLQKKALASALNLKHYRAQGRATKGVATVDLKMIDKILAKLLLPVWLKNAIR